MSGVASSGLERGGGGVVPGQKICLLAVFFQETVNMSCRNEVLAVPSVTLLKQHKHARLHEVLSNISGTK